MFPFSPRCFINFKVSHNTSSFSSSSSRRSDSMGASNEMKWKKNWPQNRRIDASLEFHVINRIFLFYLFNLEASKNPLDFYSEKSVFFSGWIFKFVEYGLRSLKIIRIVNVVLCIFNLEIPNLVFVSIFVVSVLCFKNSSQAAVFFSIFWIAAASTALCDVVPI